LEKKVKKNVFKYPLLPHYKGRKNEHKLDRLPKINNLTIYDRVSGFWIFFLENLPDHFPKCKSGVVPLKMSQLL